MSTPFPLEDQANQESLTGYVNPWQGAAPKPAWYQGIGFDEDSAYLGPLGRAIQGAGEGVAKGEEMLGGFWHSEFAGIGAAAGALGLTKLQQAAQESGQDTDSIMADARQRVKALTPDPATVGAAGQVISGVTSGFARMGLGALTGTGMLGGAAVMGGSEGVDRAQALQEQGVSHGAATVAGAVSGVLSGAGAVLPAGLGSTLLSKVLTGALGNAAFGALSRYADHSILDHAGYHDMAEQQQVWDATSMVTDLILGGGFGALAHIQEAPQRAAEQQRAATNLALASMWQKAGLRDQPGVEDAALSMNLAMRDKGAAPGVAVDPMAAGAHQAALEEATADLMANRPVSVASEGLQNATFVGRPAEDTTAAHSMLVSALREGGMLEEQRHLQLLEGALGARIRGEELPPEVVRTPTQIAPSGPEVAPVAPSDATTAPSPIPRASNLTEADRGIESRFADRVDSDYEGLKAQYAAHPDTNGGKILNTDTARELSPDYLADRTKSAAVHEPASYFIKKLYAEKLAQPPGPGEDPTVLFTAGGTGAGKTTAVNDALNEQVQRAQIVYDTNMNGAKSAQAKIDQALAAGKDVKIAYVHREPSEALTNGALTRAMKQQRKFGSGRTVPIEEHVNTHVGANDTIRALAEHYKNDPDVSIHIIDNSRGRGNAQLIDLEQLPRLDYTRTHEQAVAALEAAHTEGRISEPVYRGFRGERAGSEPGVRGQPAAGSAADAADAGEQPGRTPAGNGAAAAGELGSANGEQPQPQRTGEPTSQLVATASGRQVKVLPKVVEAADLVTSDHPNYPQELQPRQRGDRVALQEQVHNIAQNLSPERLGNSAEADRGAPITGEGNVMESGNGRVMALREVYAGSPEKAQAYKDWLTSQGHDISGMKEPVLVRERQTPMSDAERQAFAVEANQAATAELSPVERAQADAKLLDGGTLSQLRNGELSSAQNAPFVRSFLEKLPAGERNAMVNPDGTVSQQGVRRLQAAILAKAYGGNARSNATLGRMLESTDNDMRSTMGALLDAAPAFARLRQAIKDGKVAPEYDLSKALTEAVETVAQVREKGQAIGEFLKQGDLLTKRAPIVDQLMKAMFDAKGERIAGREKVAQALMDYADRAQRQRLDQGSLFGESAIPPDRLLAANEPRPGEEKVTPMRPAADMFGVRTAPARPPRSDDAAVQSGQDVIARNPNLEMPDQNGDLVRARSELLGAEDDVKSANERVPDALSIAASCAGQRAA
ncbi:MAG TPA: zeta toxin family protein [Steroidobacteraceae bacterium]|jgi:hypothetical protein